MPADPSPPYRISCPGPVLDQVRAWVDRTVARGLRSFFLDTLRGITERLSNDPLAWGEQQYHTSGHGLPVCSAAYGLLHVTFAVDVGNRVVFIMGFDLMPNSPLQDSSQM